MASIYHNNMYGETICQHGLPLSKACHSGDCFRGGLLTELNNGLGAKECFTAAWKAGLGENLVEHPIRRFETGATRDSEKGKLDYEAFLSPIVLKRYAEYLDKHRQLPDGSLRNGDNWQLGIDRNVYMKSLWRHFIDVWMMHRGYVVKDSRGSQVDFEEALCAVMFNAMGYLYEYLKGKDTCATQ